MKPFETGYKEEQKIKEIKSRQDRILQAGNVMRVLKRGIDLEEKELQEKFPKCKVCGKRFEGDKGGSFNEEKEFFCNECLREMNDEPTD